MRLTSQTVQKREAYHIYPETNAMKYVMTWEIVLEPEDHPKLANVSLQFGVAEPSQFMDRFKYITVEQEIGQERLQKGELEYLRTRYKSERTQMFDRLTPDKDKQLIMDLVDPFLAQTYPITGGWIQPKQ